MITYMVSLVSLLNFKLIIVMFFIHEPLARIETFGNLMLRYDINKLYCIVYLYWEDGKATTRK